jgi:hypothetical protein
MEKWAFSILLIVAVSFARAADQLSVNPYKVEAREIYTGAWKGTVRTFIVNGARLMDLRSDDVPLLNKIILKAQGSNTMLMMDFEAIERADRATDIEERRKNIATVLTPTNQPIMDRESK